MNVVASQRQKSQRVANLKVPAMVRSNLKAENKIPEKLERSIRLRRLRQRRYRARANAGLRFIGSFVEMRFVEFLLVEAFAFLPPGDYTDDELEIAYLALLAEWHGDWRGAYDVWRQAKLIRVGPSAWSGTIGVTVDAVVVPAATRS